MVPDLAHLALGRQRVLEVPRPARRVQTLVAQAVDHGIADDLLDAAAQARRGFRLVVPDRPEHREHQLGVDLTDRNVVNLRTVIELGPDAVLVLAEQGHVVLPDVLRVLPPGPVVGDIAAAGLLERPGRRRRGPAPGAQGKGVDALEPELPLHLDVSGACLIQVDEPQCAQPHLPAFFVEPVLRDPARGAAPGDLQIEPAAVREHPRLAGPGEPGDRPPRQPFDHSRHGCIFQCRL